ncbi:acyl-CoA dehydrogenase family protein [Sphingobium lactosutens]|uniref:Acyl-CoA dehydrogenase C-terminal domain-containing protein n=1 Tax=Sphingobium lactosutens DS20 TaxID=1331060 RepID=T0IQ86_9SPHN|nr:acyl-CoA dehydrogenase family protein [Sphingobium lactosutens]EQB11799.1 hypothetical protein RLDS_21975 [Sphingobium lactosutens DS20]
MATAYKTNDTTPMMAMDDILAQARSLRPMLAERAAQTETEGRVSQEVTQLLKQAGLYRLGQPARFGGLECTPSQQFQLGFELARGCGSTGWCSMLANGNSWMASFWPLEAQNDVWLENPDNILSCTFFPTGKSQAADGGYLVEGSWPFASNCDNADWFFVSAPLPETDEGERGAGWFLVPRKDIDIDHDSWRVAGMQGSGSKTLRSTAPIFVPSHRMIRLNDVARGTIPGRDVPGNVNAAFSFATFGSIMLVGPLLGIAQAAHDWYCEAMRTKVKGGLKPGAALTVAQTPQAQARAGEAQAKIDAAIALILHDLPPLEAKIRSGQTLTQAERVKVRRDVAFAARQASDAVNLLFEGAGASSASLDAPIQRHWRDVNVGTRHTSMDVQAIYAMVGQQSFGLEPVGVY